MDRMRYICIKFGIDFLVCKQAAWVKSMTQACRGPGRYAVVLHPRQDLVPECDLFFVKICVYHIAAWLDSPHSCCEPRSRPG